MPVDFIEAPRAVSAADQAHCEQAFRIGRELVAAPPARMVPLLLVHDHEKLAPTETFALADESAPIEDQLRELLTSRPILRWTLIRSAELNHMHGLHVQHGNPDVVWSWFLADLEAAPQVVHVMPSPLRPRRSDWVNSMVKRLAAELATNRGWVDLGDDQCRWNHDTNAEAYEERVTSARASQRSALGHSSDDGLMRFEVSEGGVWWSFRVTRGQPLTLMAMGVVTRTPGAKPR